MFPHRVSAFFSGPLLSGSLLRISQLFTPSLWCSIHTLPQWGNIWKEEGRQMAGYVLCDLLLIPMGNTHMRHMEVSFQAVTCLSFYLFFTTVIWMTKLTMSDYSNKHSIVTSDVAHVWFPWHLYVVFFFNLYSMINVMVECLSAWLPIWVDFTQ